MAVGVDSELHDEDEGEGYVDVVEGMPEPRVGVPVEGGVVLRLDDVGREVLRGRGAAGSGARRQGGGEQAHRDNEEGRGALEHGGVEQGAGSRLAPLKACLGLETPDRVFDVCCHLGCQSRAFLIRF